MKQEKQLLLSLLASALVLGCLAACTTTKANKLSLPKAETINEKQLDDKFIEATMDFAFKLYSACYDNQDNTMISPLSLMTVLAMGANGANGQTRNELEKLLTCMPISELNEYLASYQKHLMTSSKLVSSNSFWIKDDDSIKVLEDYLQILANYYQVEVYQEKFDDTTVKAINSWVKDKTSGLIKEIIQQLNPFTILCLINAVVFEAEWANVYNIEDINSGIFTDINNKELTVEYMYSTETGYLKDDLSRGFIKKYQDNEFALVALLPNEDINIEDYISKLDGKRILNLLENKQFETVNAVLPKFSYETDLDMIDILKNLDIKTAFLPDEADFGSMVDLTMVENIYISKIIHKTFINVDELGTKAGAVSLIAFDTKSAPIEEIYIVLDRPFIYLIIDTTTNLPVFIGSVLTIPNN